MTAIIFSDLTPKMYAVVCNGCGAKKGWRRFIRPPQGHARVHCDEHDFDCLKGGDAAAERAAARRMYNGMMRDALSMRWWQRPGFRFKAWIYYMFLLVLGAGFHHGEPRTWEWFSTKFDPAAPTLPPSFHALPAVA